MEITEKRLMLRWGNVGFLLAGTSTYAHTRLIMHLAFDPESSQLVGFFFGSYCPCKDWQMGVMKSVLSGFHSSGENMYGAYTGGALEKSPQPLWRSGAKVC